MRRLIRATSIALAASLFANQVFAYHGTILEFEFRGWSRDGSKFALLKKVVTSESEEIANEVNELFIVSCADSTLVERYGLHEEQTRPEYMRPYVGSTLNDQAAEDRLHRLGLQPGTLLPSAIEGDRVVISLPTLSPSSEALSLEIQIFYLMETRKDTRYVSYTAIQRIWLGDRMLFKSNHSGLDEGGLPSEKVMMANLSPNQRNLLVITKVEGYDQWFRFFIVDLKKGEILGRAIVETLRH